MVEQDWDRRFGGVGRLYGMEGLNRLAQAQVMVVGVGGVGSWVVEALARSGVGRLTLVDMDHVCPSNVNRQLQALTPDFGRSKIAALAERVQQINPQAQVQLVDDFLTPDNAAALLQAPPDVLIDATDDLKAKRAMVLHARRERYPMITVGAAGGKTQPTLVRVDDLSQALQDPLLARLRSDLRRQHAYPRTGKMRVACVYSQEPRRLAEACTATSGGLSCSGYGASMPVTAAFGLAAAAWALDHLRLAPK